MNNIFRDIASVGISKVFVILAGVGNTILLARYLGPELNGVYSALVVYPTLIMTVGSLGIRQSAAYYIGKKIYENNYVYSSIIALWFGTSIISLTICFLLISIFINAEVSLLEQLLAVLVIPFSLFITYSTGIFLGQSKIALFSRYNWIPPVVSLLFTVIFVVLLKMGLVGAFIGPIVGAGITVALLFKSIDFPKKLFKFFRWDVIYSMVKLGSLYALVLIVISLNYRINIIVLDQLVSKNQLGIYSVGAKLVEYLWQIPMLLSTIIFSRSATAKDNRKFSFQAAKLLRVSLTLVALGSFVLTFLSRQIIDLLYGVEYEESHVILKIMLPGVLLMTIFKVLNMDLAGKGKPWIALFAMLPSLALNLILNLILVPKYGIIGSATSSTICYTIATILYSFLYSRSVGLSVKEIFAFSKNDWVPIFTSIKNIYHKITHSQ